MDTAAEPVFSPTIAAYPSREANASQTLWQRTTQSPRAPAIGVPDSGDNRAIGPLRPQQARKWSLVLQSQSIPFLLRREAGAVFLELDAADYERGWHSIELYEDENRHWPPRDDKDEPRHTPSLAVVLLMGLMALFFGRLTGPVHLGSGYFDVGRADAELLFSEPWRMVTALTLHADSAHIFGNFLSASIFGVLLSQRIGGGGALFAFIAGGTLGNAFNALHHLADGHRSIGASTAVFAMVGTLSIIQVLLLLRRKRTAERAPRIKPIDVIAPILGGLVLLGTLGAGGGNTDVHAHGYGFVAGLLVGLPIGLYLFFTDTVPRRGRRLASSSFWLQSAALVATTAVVAGAWWLALATG